jgi:hypothetical protein
VGKPVAYIAGPFRGPTAWDIETNCRRVEGVALEVSRLGAMPLPPHLLSRFFHGQGPDAFWLEGTMEILRRSDALVLVEGWERSEGAKAEAEEAARRMIPVFEWASEGDRSEFATWARTWAPPAPRVGERGNAASRAGSGAPSGIGEGDRAPLNVLAKMAREHAEGLRHLQAVEEEHGAALRRVEELEADLEARRRECAGLIEAAFNADARAESLAARLQEQEKALREIERLAAGILQPPTATRHIRTLASVALGTAGGVSPSPSGAPCPGSGGLEGLPAGDPPREIRLRFSPCADPLCCPAREEGGSR